ncbi:MAG: hypothetical protein GTN96_18610, partial [Gammaproteobacteria bacterium]|nr:hypothetical protein [Gammaproteobacteria bacterium]
MKMPNKFVLAVLAGLLILGVVSGIRGMVHFVQNQEFRAPQRVEVDARDATPRDRGLADEQAERDEKNTALVYEEKAYRQIGGVSSRVIVWMLAQLHLLFAAFVLAVPMFALIIEFIGYKTGDKRYDKLAYEFTKLLSVSFSLTATFGAFLLFMLVLLYPKFMTYLMHVFKPTFLPYVALFFFEAVFLYSYYYGWGKFSPRVHLFLGLMLNLVGTAIMFIANAWLTFMTSPAGISETGAVISTWEAVTNYTWMPINIHRHHRQRRLRRVDRRRLRRVQVPHGPKRRGARALRLDGLHRQLRGDQRVPAAAVRRLLAGQRDLRLLADAGPADDGRRLLLAVHHPGGADRQPVPGRQLLPVAGHGPHRGRGALPEVHQVPVDRHRAVLRDLGHAALDHCH